MQKSATHYTEAAYDEITLLQQIAEGDPEGEHGCCRLFDSFEHTGPHGEHVCMVFEVLGDNLLTLIKRCAFGSPSCAVFRHPPILTGRRHYWHAKKERHRSAAKRARCSVSAV